MDYFQGVGVKKDAKLALEWLMKAASQGYVDAYYNLGSIFLEGYKGTEGRLKETMHPNFPEHCS
jgi:TPR repeat protein